MLLRKCPKCNKDIIYKSVSGFYNANKNNSKCRKCVSIENGFIERYATKGKNTGSDNAFYKKKHAKESLKKAVESRKKNNHVYKTKEFREKISSVTKGNRNPMYGKTFYEVWTEKYGKEKADELFELKRENNRKASSGNKNPMYGKPTPQGSGNGWSGWYKDYFFRSLRELSYIITVLETKGYLWESAEKFSIKYIDCSGLERTYRADFIVNNKYMVEIKPKKLHNSPLVLAKKKAAQKFCKKNGLKYKIIDCKILSHNKIKELKDNGIFRFTDRYEKLYQEKYCNIV